MKNEKVMISIRDISKAFPSQNGPNPVLQGVSLDIRDQEFVCMIGYSGCGKSTLLRIIAGMEYPDGGEILVDGHPHEEPDKDVILLFQDFNQLFPWKSVLNNIVHPLRATGKIRDKRAARERAMALLDGVGLTSYANYYPHQLSGGMRQRAAIARALALEPKVLLMDEPLSALDDVTRKTLRELIRDVCAAHRVTTVCVTHSIEEAIIMGSRIVAMDRNTHGIAQVIQNTAHDTPENLEERLRMRAVISQFMSTQ